VKPRRTVRSTTVFRLAGGTEDNDLWVEPRVDESERPVLSSTWEPSPQERVAIAGGQNVELLVWGAGTPPVAVSVTDVEIVGKRISEPRPGEKVMPLQLALGAALALQLIVPLVAHSVSTAPKGSERAATFGPAQHDFEQLEAALREQIPLIFSEEEIDAYRAKVKPAFDAEEGKEGE
jgi:hypothetical protein